MERLYITSMSLSHFLHDMFLFLLLSRSYISPSINKFAYCISWPMSLLNSNISLLDDDVPPLFVTVHNSIYPWYINRIFDQVNTYLSVRGYNHSLLRCCHWLLEACTRQSSCLIFFLYNYYNWNFANLLL